MVKGLKKRKYGDGYKLHSKNFTAYIAESLENKNKFCLSVELGNIQLYYSEYSTEEEADSMGRKKLMEKQNSYMPFPV